MKYKVAFQPDITVVFFSGNIDEKVGEALTEVRPQVKTKRVVFQCEGINLINSIGISTWIAHLRSYDDLDLSYSHMPYTFISLCRIIPLLAANRFIHSFFVRYYCERCKNEDPQFGLVQRQDALKANAIPTFACKRCKTQMPVDPNDEDYVSFFQS